MAGTIFGLCVIVAYLCVMIFLLGMFFDSLTDGMERLLIGAFIVFMAGIPFFIYADSHEPKFTLNKSEWECSQSHTVTTMIYTGKVMVPSVSTVCDNYHRR